jgi:hypothetical protein
MKKIAISALVVLGAVSLAVACSPAVGSKEWCDDLKKKDKAQWTAQEAKDFAANCILPK